MTNETIDLTGEWQLTFGPQDLPASGMTNPAIPGDWKTIPARVPGNVELDLIEAGLLPPDLEKGHNIYLLRAFEKHQWWYRREFDAVKPRPGFRCELVLEGADTLASVWINGEKAGSVANMLVPHRLDVTDILREGANEIIVGLDSPVLEAYRHPIPPGERTHDHGWEALNTRKAAHCFGWDIFPRAVTAGLWRGVRLEYLPPIRFGPVYLATCAIDPAARTADTWLTWDIIAPPHTDTDTWEVEYEVVDPESGETAFADRFPVLCRHASRKVRITNIDPWWPRGFGPSRLYRFRLRLRDGAGTTLAEESFRTGFRTVRLERTDLLDADGNGRFAFVVNDEEMFVKGTNWVPLDAFHSRDADRLEENFGLVLDLNCNMVRCWGGGVYEDQRFFDLCDEAGVLVWQDFALACIFYPQTAAFHGKVRQEAETLIPLLRNHPSLALWAGNNEVDQFYRMHMPHIDPNAADRISRDVLATACRQFDPWRDYLPSSPYVSPALFAAGNPPELRPEDHLWGPCDDFKGDHYAGPAPLFASEIGFHGCPSRKSLERMMTAEGLWPWQENDEWLAHSVRPMTRGVQFTWRLPKMAREIEALFGFVPEELDDYVFASQFSQAEALKFFIERFRLRKGRCSGILWWNLRDGWPVISGDIVDYFGEKKLAYEVVRRVMGDTCVLVDEARDGAHAIVAVNDTRDAMEARVRLTHGSSPLLETEVSLPPNGRLHLGSFPTVADPTFLAIEWTVAGRTHRSHYLAGPRPLDLPTCRDWYARAGLAGPEA